MKRICWIGMAMAALATALPAAAQGAADVGKALSSERFTLVSPFPPGGPTDTLARVMHHIGQQRPVPGTHPGIESLVQPVFDAARAFFEAADPESVNAPARAGGPWLALEARDTFEDAYRIAKAGLLQAGAGGTVDVVAVYEHLARLSDLRRAVGQGFKAVQRMAALPELSTLGHGAPTRPAAESDSGRSVESAE